ncbi:MAG: extracellular solute-binding protein [Litorivicinus sp.]
MKNLLVALSLSAASVAQAADVVNVYSARKEALILPLLEQFTDRIGVEVRLITGSADELVTRLKTEDVASPADLFVTVDAGRAVRAQQAGVLGTLPQADFLDRVPQAYIDEKRNWVALSLRARVMFYAKGKIDPSDIDTYAEVADPKNQGKLCIRSSGNIYNQSLVGAMLENEGAEATQAWAKGVVANMARQPAGGDTDQIRAVAAGVCDFAVANTYYFGRLLASDKPEDQAVVEKVGMIWPDQEGRGTHINASMAGITRYAPNRENAEKLLAFLLSDEAQRFYAEINHEFPVIPGVAASKTMQTYGDFKRDALPLEVLGVNNAAAVKTMDRAGWQ